MKTLFEQPSTTCVAPWFGSNRMLGPCVGQELKGCDWVGVPFAGGCAELLHIDARELLVSDKHRLIIHLCRVMADATYGPRLFRELRRPIFTQERLDLARQYCRKFEPSPADEELSIIDYCLAMNYFICVWMNRSGKAGTDDEFKGKIPVRWNANGGGSAVRYQSAARSIPAWRRVLAKCNFVTLDVFEFLSKAKDAPKNGIYLDPPFPGPGDSYFHKFSEMEHLALSVALREYKQTRVVCRFYDHPLVRDLYPEGQWTWRYLKGRDQANNDEKPEVLIINGPSYAEAA